MEEVMETMFLMPRLYKEARYSVAIDSFEWQLRVWFSLGQLLSEWATAERDGQKLQLRVCSLQWGWREMVAACEDVSPEAEERQPLEATWLSHELYKCPINPIVKQKPTYSHSIAWQCVSNWRHTVHAISPYSPLWNVTCSSERRIRMEVAAGAAVSWSGACG
jgi:hypothetical protein